MKGHARFWNGSRVACACWLAFIVTVIKFLIVCFSLRTVRQGVAMSSRFLLALALVAVLCLGEQRSLLSKRGENKANVSSHSTFVPNLVTANEIIPP